MLKGRKPKEFVATPPTLMSDFFYSELVQFLRARSLLLAPKDLAEEWNRRWQNDFDPEFVNEQQIRYLQDKLGLSLSREAREKLPGPRKREAERRKKISRQIQDRTDSGAAERRQEFLQLRATFRSEHQGHPEHLCPHCQESLPLDPLFFTRYKKKETYYFDKAHCLLCRSERRRLNYRAEKKGEEAPCTSSSPSRIKKRELALEALQQALLAEHADAPVQDCVRCQKTRLLDPRFFQLNGEKLSYSCVICIATRRSKKRKAKRRGARSPSAKRRRRETHQLIHRMKYPQWKEERLSEAVELLRREPNTPVRVCIGCTLQLPLKTKWFRMFTPRDSETEVILNDLCIPCLCDPEKKQSRKLR